jgi:cell division protein DivIC
MKVIRQIPNWLKNKYLLVGLFFIVWMLFFAEKDIFSGIKQYKKLNSLQKSEQYQVKTIAEAGKELELLKTNAQTIEKYAREKYLMKKDNEDIFIISNSIDNK